MMAGTKFDPVKDIPDLTGRVYLVTGGVFFYFLPFLLHAETMILLLPLYDLSYQILTYQAPAASEPASSL